MTDNALDRRHLVAGATALLTAAAGEASARTISGSQPWEPHHADAPQPLEEPNLVFFTPAEAAFVNASTERLIPADDLGPGANQCGVTLFIDHQLAGAYGRAQSWYMQGPWAKGEETQGFQSRYNPASLYRAAIAAIEAHVHAAEVGKTFAQLPPEAQDQLLGELEAGKIELQGVDAKTFFTLLMLNTKEGMFCDPIYGGNKDMAGWKMLGFPGARYDYRSWAGRHGQRYSEPPVGLKGRPAWTHKG